MFYFIKFHWKYFYFNFSEFVSDSALIPRKSTVKECRGDTIAYKSGYDANVKPYIYRCYCEEHCDWEKCRLAQAPDDCLIQTDIIWMWDSEKQYWVAQHSQGNIQY